MPKIKRNKWKRFRTKYLKFIYTQRELLILKDDIQIELNTKASELYRSIKTALIDKENKIFDLTISERIISEFKEIQRIQKKIKKKVAFNNLIYNINNYIFNAENTKKLHFTLSKFHDGRNKGNKKIFFEQLDEIAEENSNPKISDIIDNLEEKINNISNKQNKLNNLIFSFIFTKSFVLKKFNKKRMKILI
jgi:hypothetical protein